MTKKGTTLIELLLVIAVIFIVFRLLTPHIHVPPVADKIYCGNNLTKIWSALELYSSAHNTYPASLAYLNTPAYIDDFKILKCPSPNGNFYTYFKVPTEISPPDTEIVRCAHHENGGVVSLYKGGKIKIH